MFVGLLPPQHLHRAARLESLANYTPLPPGWGEDAGEDNAGGGGGERGSGVMKRVLGWIESVVFVGVGNSGVWRKVCLPSSNGVYVCDCVCVCVCVRVRVCVCVCVRGCCRNIGLF